MSRSTHKKRAKDPLFYRPDEVPAMVNNSNEKGNEMEEIKIVETLNANDIRDTIYLMEENEPTDALHLAEQLREQVEEFVSAIEELATDLNSDDEIRILIPVVEDPALLEQISELQKENLEHGHREAAYQYDIEQLKEKLEQLRNILA